MIWAVVDASCGSRARFSRGPAHAALPGVSISCRFGMSPARTARSLPQSDQFELYALGRILSEWADSRVHVEEILKGDQGSFTFDWLVRTEKGCVAIEVVRAEDPDQLDRIEAEVSAGADVVTGTAEMPWASVDRLVQKKVERANRPGGYRDQLDELECAERELHLAVTSWGQDLSLLPDLIWPHLESGLGVFDVVWLVHGDLVECRGSS